jgi:hypothetical protein
VWHSTVVIIIAHNIRSRSCLCCQGTWFGHSYTSRPDLLFVVHLSYGEGLGCCPFALCYAWTWGTHVMAEGYAPVAVATTPVERVLVWWQRQQNKTLQLLKMWGTCCQSCHLTVALLCLNATDSSVHCTILYTSCCPWRLWAQVAASRCCFSKSYWQDASQRGCPGSSDGGM